LPARGHFYFALTQRTEQVAHPDRIS
jgi:hypothetical protein